MSIPWTFDQAMTKKRFQCVRNKISKLIFWSLIAVSVIFSYACNSKEKERMIFDKLLSMPVDQLIQLSNVLNASEGVACILLPHQFLVHDNIAETAIFNDHLKSINYIESEDRWAIIVAIKDKVTLFEIHRSNKLDISQINSLPATKLGAKIIQKNCVNIQTGIFIKTIYNNRAYLLFGEIK